MNYGNEHYTHIDDPNGEPFTFRPMYSIEAPQWGAAMTSQQVYWDQADVQEREILRIISDHIVPAVTTE